MKLEDSTKGIYKVITIYDSLSVIADLAELKTKIEEYLEKDDKYIAVKFFDASYLYSGAISILITCYRMIKDKGGDLCILEPNNRILELLIQMNIDSLIDICNSEDELLDKSAVYTRKQT